MDSFSLFFTHVERDTIIANALINALRALQTHHELYVRAQSQCFRLDCTEQIAVLSSTLRMMGIDPIEDNAAALD